MFAINHAATGLIIKRIFPGVSVIAILVSVQLIEGLWVVLNFIGIEKTTTEKRVESVSDVHLEYMPFSHSVVSRLSWRLPGGYFSPGSSSPLKWEQPLHWGFVLTLCSM